MSKRWIINYKVLIIFKVLINVAACGGDLIIKMVYRDDIIHFRHGQLTAVRGALLPEEKS